jgi:hypothetical protein
VGAIYIDPKVNRATIDSDVCVECGTCFRMSKENLNPTFVRTVRGLAKTFRFRFDPEPDVCPTSSFVVDDLEWPRIVRRVFSDPLVEHKSTGIHGRGTEEVKTNDVSPRVGMGEVGYVIEFGRPGVGVRFHHIQTMTMALAALGVAFEAKNPVTHLMTDKSKGILNQDLLNERILSAIVEIKTGIDLVPKVLDTIAEVAKQIDTVMALGVSTRCDENGEDRVLAPLLEDLGYTYERAKTNMGLGRITNIQKKEQVGDQHLASVR